MEGSGRLTDPEASIVNNETRSSRVGVSLGGLINDKNKNNDSSRRRPDDTSSAAASMSVNGQQLHPMNSGQQQMDHHSGHRGGGRRRGEGSVNNGSLQSSVNSGPWPSFSLPPTCSTRGPWPCFAPTSQRGPGPSFLPPQRGLQSNAQFKVNKNSSSTSARDSKVRGEEVDRSRRRGTSAESKDKNNETAAMTFNGLGHSVNSTRSSSGDKFGRKTGTQSNPQSSSVLKSKHVGLHKDPSPPVPVAAAAVQEVVAADVREEEEGAKECPLCTEPLDEFESKHFYPCSACSFQLCLFCFHRIRTEFEPTTTSSSQNGTTSRLVLDSIRASDPIDPPTVDGHESDEHPSVTVEPAPPRLSVGGTLGECPGCRTPYPGDIDRHIDSLKRNKRQEMKRNKKQIKDEKMNNRKKKLEEEGNQMEKQEEEVVVEEVPVVNSKIKEESENQEQDSRKKNSSDASNKRRGGSRGGNEENGKDLRSSNRRRQHQESDFSDRTGDRNQRRNPNLQNHNVQNNKHSRSGFEEGKKQEIVGKEDKIQELGSSETGAEDRKDSSSMGGKRGGSYGSSRTFNCRRDYPNQFFPRGGRGGGGSNPPKDSPYKNSNSSEQTGDKEENRSEVEEERNRSKKNNYSRNEVRGSNRRNSNNSHRSFDEESKDEESPSSMMNTRRTGGSGRRTSEESQNERNKEERGMRTNPESGSNSRNVFQFRNNQDYAPSHSSSFQNRNSSSNQNRETSGNNSSFHPHLRRESKTFFPSSNSNYYSRGRGGRRERNDSSSSNSNNNRHLFFGASSSFPSNCENVDQHFNPSAPSSFSPSFNSRRNENCPKDKKKNFNKNDDENQEGRRRNDSTKEEGSCSEKSSSSKVELIGLLSRIRNLERFLPNEHELIPLQFHIFLPTATSVITFRKTSFVRNGGRDELESDDYFVLSIC